ncbi:TonB-dependent receptor plug domain-containing protein [Hanstruepera marina]|uniref:TonB-dependent receptor plug domain-containing protein n=1 Tax=Hanstruepera marina TaxID=2873265 RepID=UPI001CA770B4|nr:TonB-dependent receptor plug domain-containing protein [Hanstruepera marina]
MNKKTWFFGVLCATSLLGYSQQQTDSTKVERLEEVVITDSRFELNREQSGKVITRITRQDIENLKGQSVAEIINNTVGIEINGVKSNAGQNLSYYVRGGRNRQVLVLIDGIALTDPSQIANDYDLRLLNVNQVESIEVLKGASSTLYGSGAATAVININLKESAKKPFEVSLRSIIGTNQSQDNDNYAIKNFNNAVTFNGTLNKFSYLASFGNQFTNGLSAVENGEEPDAFNSYNGLLKLGYNFSDAFIFKAYGSFDKFKADFDDGFLFQDADNQSISEQFRIGISPEFKYNNGSITLNAVYNDVIRTIESSFPSKFYANSFVADLFNKYNFSETFYTVVGLNAQQNEMESFVIPFGSNELEQSINPDEATFTIVDPYLNMVYISEFGLNVNAGLRLNNHSEYGSHVVYNINPSYRKDFNFGYLKLLASYSTAYITPSLYQLFEPAYGNKELQPEENATIEGGLEVSFGDKAIVSVVYFNRKETNFIDFIDLGNFVYQYKNVEDEFTASGLEFTANYNITKALSLNANVTYTKVPEDLDLRIPELKINGQLNYRLGKATLFSLAYQYNDDRNDMVYNSMTFENDTVVLESYNLLDFYVSHSILDNKLTIFANLDNVFNEDYQELYGYSTLGRNISLGLNLTL